MLTLSSTLISWILAHSLIRASRSLPNEGVVLGMRRTGDEKGETIGEGMGEVTCSGVCRLGQLEDDD